jgi:hypothetical protein
LGRRYGLRCSATVAEGEAGAAAGVVLAVGVAAGAAAGTTVAVWICWAVAVPVAVAVSEAVDVAVVVSVDVGPVDSVGELVAGDDEGVCRVSVVVGITGLGGGEVVPGAGGGVETDGEAVVPPGVAGA